MINAINISNQKYVLPTFQKNLKPFPFIFYFGSSIWHFKSIYLYNSGPLNRKLTVFSFSFHLLSIDENCTFLPFVIGLTQNTSLYQFRLPVFLQYIFHTLVLNSKLFSSLPLSFILPYLWGNNMSINHFALFKNGSKIDW